MRDSKSRDNVLAWKSTRSRTDLEISDAHVLALTGCMNSKAIGWSIQASDQDLEKICWKEKLGSKHQAPLCLYKREPLFPL
jgi:hypothetical protein